MTHRKPITGAVRLFEPSDTVATGNKLCIVCGSAFTPAACVRRPPLYCSNPCRQKACRTRTAEREREREREQEMEWLKRVR
jgi:hypothetical protein